MSALWVYVRVQLVIFVFGIVGPIFLVVYFTSQPDPTMKVMYWLGLFITAADIVIALMVTDRVIRSDQDSGRPWRPRGPDREGRQHDRTS